MRPITAGGLPAALLAGVLLVAWAAVPSAGRQAPNPVYADDSTPARDTLDGLGALLAVGNTTEASRALQRLLDREGDRVVEREPGGDLYVSVRATVHRRLLEHPELLDRYVELEEPRARDLVSRGAWDEAERTRLLTPSGFEAALRVAQLALEAGRFEASHRALLQLEDHPVRREGGASAREAARLLALVSRYIDRGSVRERAGRWLEEAADAGGVGDRVPEPEGLRPEVRDVLGRGGAPAVSLERIVPLPINAVPLSAEGGEGLVGRVRERSQERGSRVPQSQRGGFGWALPSALGDVLYVTDGSTVSAWDRFTLRRLWKMRPEGAFEFDEREPWRASARSQIGRRVEDTATVTIAGDLLLTTTGQAMSGDREGNGRLHALDRETGATAWSVDIASLEDRLNDSSVRGPVIVEEGTAVVASRKNLRTRRLVGLYFVGLDARTGEHLWTRPVASAGALPVQQFGRLTDAAVSHEGVVYRVDEIGVIGAVEIATGRPVWIRRLPARDMYARDSRPSWTTSVPVINGGTMVTMSPDRRQLLRVRLEDGEILERRDSTELALPIYVVRVGEHLAAVGTERVAVLPMDDLSGGRVRQTWLREGGIAGRAVAAGDRLLLPTPEGVEVMDPRSPSERELIGLDTAGNVLVLDGQLLVVNESEVHSYLVWDVASRMLAERMDAAPDDPSPAVTLAELAYRAGHADRIVPAVDRALEAIDRRPAGEAARHASGRLFEALLAMLEDSQARWFGEGARDPARPDERPGAEGRAGPISDLGVLTGLADRLGRVADTPGQRVSHRMVLGRLREAAADPARAIEAYQEILLDGDLARATWRGRQISMRAELEASRRVRRLIGEHGSRVYRAFEHEAERELAALGDGAGGAELEALAGRYPGARIGPALWLAAAEAHRREGAEHRAVRALQSGLGSAEMLARSGRAAAPEVVGEIAGTLASSLARAGRVGEARRVLERAGRVELTDRGSPVDAEALRSQLRERLERLHARARIGRDVEADSSPALVRGRVLGALSMKPAAAPLDAALMYVSQESELRLVEPSEGNGDDSPVRTRWSLRAAREPVLLRLDERGVLLHRPGDGGGSVALLSLEDGEEIWSSGPLGDVIAGGAGGERDAFDEARLVLTLDGQTMVVAERSGRAAAFDLDDGRVLWARSTGVNRVYDADVGAGVVVLAGAALERGGVPGAMPDERPVIEALDARTGEMMSRLDDLGSRVSWVRVTESGDLVAGLDRGVLSVAVVEGRVQWTIEDDAARETQDAWVFDDRLFLLHAGGELRLVSLATGRIGDAALETRGRLQSRSRLAAYRVGENVAFAGASGIVVLSPSGELVGADALDAQGRLVTPEPVDGMLLTVEARDRRRDRARMHRLHLLESETARLVATYDLRMFSDAERVTAINGRILISAGDVTMVLRAPAD